MLKIMRIMIVMYVTKVDNREKVGSSHWELFNKCS